MLRQEMFIKNSHFQDTRLSLNQELQSLMYHYLFMLYIFRIHILYYLCCHLECVHYFYYIIFNVMLFSLSVSFVLSLIYFVQLY